MKADEFAMVETVDRDALASHPMWKTYRPGDRVWILGWGVDPETLDAELERFGYCGPEPLFPVLDCERLPEERTELFVSACFSLASGVALPGYLLEPFAFGLFTEQEFAFNRGLPDFARRMAEKLAGELGISVDQIFPLSYGSPIRGRDGQPLTGEIAAPW